MGLLQHIKPSHRDGDDPYDASTLIYLIHRPNELKLDNLTYNGAAGWVSLNNNQLFFSTFIK